MNESNKDENINKEDNNSSSEKKSDNQKVKLSTEEKLKISEEKLLRSLADSENQRRRFEKEIKDAFEFGGFNFAREILATLDNLQRAKQSLKSDQSLQESKDLKKFLSNFEILEKDLISIFEKNNIKKIDCINKKFDPNSHQAMLEVEDENIEEGNIVKEIQPGYMYGNRLLRPSFVAVSKKKAHKDNKKKD